MTACLKELLNNEFTTERTADNTNKFIISALLIDTYPPEMHYKLDLAFALFFPFYIYICLYLILTKLDFRLDVVFNTLYREHYSAA